jgi:hypothetical protein
MKRLSNAFSYVFSDNEWFNKVLVGGLYLLLIPLGIGLIMLNGYLVEFISRNKNGDKGMPFWRNYKIVFGKGLPKSWFSLIIIVAVYVFAGFINIEITIPYAILSVTFFLTVNSLFITNTFDLFSIFVSCVLLLIALSIGWMWIVVGWPLLIFLAILVQIHLFTNPN